METLNNISDSEWKVMEVVWKKPGLLIGEIRDSLKESGWSYSTIKTLVLRLVNKDMLYTKASEKGKMYFASVDEKASKNAQTRNFIDRIYNGSVKMMVSSLVNNSKLSESEAEALFSLIDKIEE